MFKSNLFNDHTSISKEIENSLKNKSWDSILCELPYGTFIVGGFIRDIILGRTKEKPDIDLVVPMDPLIIAEQLLEKFTGKLVVLDKKRNIVRIIFEEIILDIAEQRGESLLNDLSYRDFTINSIAFSLDSSKIIDPFDGINDLKEGLIKTQAFKNLLDDPLRILRCFRFISELEFTVEKVLLEFIIVNKNKLKSVSGERIQYELKKIYNGQNSLSTILLINQIAIFDWIQSYQNISSNCLKSYSLLNFDFESNEHKALFYLIETLDQSSIKQFKFSKSDNHNSDLLRKWRNKLIFKSIDEFDEIERFDLHKDLENILPSFIIYLPSEFHSDWIKRWKNKEDSLFHPKSLISGDIIKEHIDIDEGPLLGKLMRHLSIEFAYKRLNNFDEAIYNAKQWFKQNAPKCD